MDRQLRKEIIAEVAAAMREYLEVANERWLTGDELCKQFGMFTPSWLKMYGHTLPRQRAEVYDDGGQIRSSRWAYPQHQIARMVADGTIKEL